MTDARRPLPIPLLIVSGNERCGATLAAAVQVLDGYAGTVLLAHGATPSAETPSSIAGCLCCAPDGDIARSLETLLRDRDNNRRPDIPALVVLVAARADPLPILATVTRHPYLSLRFSPARLVHIAPADATAPPADRVLSPEDVDALCASPPALAALLTDATDHPEPLRRALYGLALGNPRRGAWRS